MEAMVNAAWPHGVNVVVTADIGGVTTHVEGTATAVAAMMHIGTAVLGDGTDSDEEYVAPFHTPHLIWDYLLDSPGVSMPEKIKTLIDCGLHTVLIDSQVVDRLALWWRKLPKLLQISLAIRQGEIRLVLKEWVKLVPSTVNSSWRSCPIHAVIAHNLACPVILGRLFLKINQFVINHNVSSCMSKLDGIDLFYKEPQVKAETQKLNIIEGATT